MIASLVTWLVKLGFGGIVDKTIDLMKYRAQLETDKEKLRTEVAIEQMKAAVEETRIMAAFNEKKLSFPWFWLMASMFVVPLGLWWNAILLDSIFHFGWKIADLPTQNLQNWAGSMIQWIFYVGSGVAVIKGLQK